MLPLLLVFVNLTSFIAPFETTFAPFEACQAPRIAFTTSRILINIPENASSITLFTNRSFGPFLTGPFHLRSCSYTPGVCEFIFPAQYLARCPSILELNPEALMSNTTANVTAFVPRGVVLLSADYFEISGGYYSHSPLQEVFLNITSPSLLYNSASPSCVFNANQTSCVVNVSVQGSGTCFYPSNANASIANTSLVNGTWNCSTGFYQLDLLFPPTEYQEEWFFTNASLSNQTLEGIVTITNPTTENLSIPFAFGTSLGSNATGEIFISAGGQANATRVFTGQIIRYNLSTARFFDYTDAFEIVSINASNSAPIPFNFSLPGCPSRFVFGNENFSLRCPLSINYSVSNWTAVNRSLFSVLFSLSSPASVVNSSSFFSEFLSINTTTPDFFYAEPLFLNLSGEFLDVRREEVAQGNAFLYSYFLELLNPPNASVNAAVFFNLSEFDQVALLGNYSCDLICLVDKAISVNVFNQTNFSVLALRASPQQVQSSSGSSSTYPVPGGGSGGSTLGSTSRQPFVEQNDSVKTDFEALVSEANTSSEFLSEINEAVETHGGEIEIEADVKEPGSATGLATAFPVELLPIGLALSGLAFLALRRLKR